MKMTLPQRRCRQLFIALSRSRAKEESRIENFGYTNEDDPIPFTKTPSNRHTAIPENQYD